MRSQLVLALVTIVTVASFGDAARADKPSSLVHYENGKRHYRAGQFAEAIAEFEKAYALYPATEYLFNLGQAYRRTEDCRALDYYRRYLEGEPESPHRPLVETHIEALAEQCKTAAAEPAGELIPVKLLKRSEPERPSRPSTPSYAGRGVTARVEAGVAFYDLGDVITPTVVRPRFSGGYAFVDGPVDVAAMLSIDIAPMRFAADPNGTALFTSVLANVEVGWNVGARWRARAEVGAGVLVMSGLSEGNPFIENGAEHGTLSMFDLRVAVGVDYRLTDRYTLNVSPGVYTRGAGHDALSADIDSVASFAVLAGVGAQM